MRDRRGRTRAAGSPGCSSVARSSPKLCHSPSEIAGSCSPLGRSGGTSSGRTAPWRANTASRHNHMPVPLPCAGIDRSDLDGGRLGRVRTVRTDLPMFCEESRTAVFLRHRHPAARLAGDLPLGRLHGPPGARRLSRRAIVLLELTRPTASRAAPSVDRKQHTTQRRDCRAPIRPPPDASRCPKPPGRLYRP